MTSSTMVSGFRMDVHLKEAVLSVKMLRMLLSSSEIVLGSREATISETTATPSKECPVDETDP